MRVIRIALAEDDVDVICKALQTRLARLRSSVKNREHKPTHAEQRASACEQIRKTEGVLQRVQNLTI